MLLSEDALRNLPSTSHLCLLPALWHPQVFLGRSQHAHLPSSLLH